MPLITCLQFIWHNAFAFSLIGVAMASAAPATAQTISGSTPLSFGSFVAGSGGTVAVSVNGLRTASGNVILINSGPGGASQSTVTGTAGSTYSITLPDNGVVVLSDNNSNTMAVNDFISIPSATSGSTGILSAGSQTLYIGATLIVAQNQPAGNYSGTFNVTVSYP